ncbi:MAG: hypothetical protein ACREJK_11745, partial [Candidatus Methylomirabilales bacterium]
EMAASASVDATPEEGGVREKMPRRLARSTPSDEGEGSGSYMCARIPGPARRVPQSLGRRHPMGTYLP